MSSTRVKSIDSEFDVKRETETFQLTDKVKYRDFVRETLPEEMMFPEELNRFLRDQIRELTSENGCLRRSLEEAEERLVNLDKTISQTDTNTSQSISKSNEIATTKIVELSKKCRDQTAEIEVLKSRCKKLEAKLAEKNKSKETKSCVDSGDGIDIRPFTIEDELKKKEEEIKLLQEKMQQINSKLYESKNASTSLRQELNKAHKLLSREIGENVTTANLSSRQSGWRGRAETIRHLQNKLIEYEGTNSKESATTLLEKRNMTNLRKIEKERRQRAEDSARELRQMSLDLEVYKRKQDAAKARVKVLENDLISAKQSIAVLNEKRSHDEQLIQALNGQLKIVEEKFRDKERDMTSMKDRAENECMNISTDLNRLQAINDNLRRTIEERETEIDTLKSGTNTIRGEKDNRKESPLSQGRCNDRESSRSNGDRNEYVTLGIAAEAERERLLEFVIVLNRRLDEERFVTDKIGETLRGERSKSARLETKLQRLEMERIGMSRVNTGYKPRFTKSGTSYPSEIEGDEMRFRLELLEEECLALKTRLATVQRDKASDLAMYKQMLDQARKTFQDAYRGKPNSSSYSTITI